MVKDRLTAGKRKEGVARLEFARAIFFIYILRSFIMINNTSLQKWNRLAQKQLDRQFATEIISGLQCSPFEANAILDTVYKVYGPYFETSGTLKPGQILLPIISVETASNTALCEGAQVTVVLTLDAGKEDLEIRRTSGVTGLRRHRVQRMTHEAFQQGGLLTLEDLGHRLLNCGQRTLCRDIKALKANNIILPLRSTIKDMGRAISHRTLIVEHWLKGKEYVQISKSTFHSIASVKGYVSKFKRIIALANEGFDVHEISFLVKISASLAEQYYQLYQTAPMLPHRKRELESFLKKSLTANAPLRRQL
jgi:hypothetical protein